MHEHHVKKGIDKELIDEINLMVEGEVFRTFDAKNYAIALATDKTFLAQRLFNEDVVELVQHLKGDKFHQMMDKFLPLCSPNI